MIKMMVMMMMMMISTRQAFHFSDWLFWASPGARLIFWLSSYFHFHFQSSESENQVPHWSYSNQFEQIMICRAGPHSDLFSLLYTSLLLLALLSMAASTRYSWHMPSPLMPTPGILGICLSPPSCSHALIHPGDWGLTRLLEERFVCLSDYSCILDQLDLFANVVLSVFVCLFVL